MRIDLPVKPALLSYCRQLIADGASPDDSAHIYRGTTLCFVPAPLGVFAALTTEENATRSIRFRHWRELPPQSGEYASTTAARGCGGHKGPESLSTAMEKHTPRPPKGKNGAAHGA